MNKVLSTIKQYLPMLIVVLIALWIFSKWFAPCGKSSVTEVDLQPTPGSTETPVGSMVQAEK